MSIAGGALGALLASLLLTQSASAAPPNPTPEVTVTGSYRLIGVSGAVGPWRDIDAPLTFRLPRKASVQVRSTREPGLFGAVVSGTCRVAGSAPREASAFFYATCGNR